jgi:hypothetical protein
VYLEVTLINGQNYSIPVEKDHSLVPLEKSGRELFVRYEQIVLVSPKT